MHTKPCRSQACACLPYLKFFRRDRVSGAELARRPDVDLRIIKRHIVRLTDLSIPIDSTPGVGGAYRLRSGSRLPPLLLTKEEAFALSLGLRPPPQIGLEALAPAREGSLVRLERVLPQALRESIRVVEDTVADSKLGVRRDGHPPGRYSRAPLSSLRCTLYLA
jgi:predicted DNA-binding transcriptional regulator YafY